jgi:hypothetical protein
VPVVSTLDIPLENPPGSLHKTEGRSCRLFTLLPLGPEARHHFGETEELLASC